MKKCIVLFLCLTGSFIFLAGCSHHNAAMKKDKSEASRNLGEAYMSEGNYTKALRELLKAEQIYADDPYLQNSLGLTYMAKGNMQKAVAHFRRAIELKPEYSAARNNLGTAYVATEQWDNAIECFNRVKDDLLYATPYYPLTNLGYVYLNLGEYGKARRNFREALELKAGFPKALQGLGQVYMATGEYEKAIDKFEEVIEIVPTSGRLYLNLGRAYEKNYDYNKALNAYKKAGAMGKGTSVADNAEEAVDSLRQMW